MSPRELANQPDFAKGRAAVNHIWAKQPPEYPKGGKWDRAFDESLADIRETLTEAESEIARLRQENGAARVEALALFNAMDHEPAQPLDSVAGIISQISNMVAGLREALKRAGHEKLMLARLASGKPEFDSPLVEWAAASLRDEILAAR